MRPRRPSRISRPARRCLHPVGGTPRLRQGVTGRRRAPRTDLRPRMLRAADAAFPRRGEGSDVRLSHQAVRPFSILSQRAISQESLDRIHIDAEPLGGLLQRAEHASHNRYSRSSGLPRRTGNNLSDNVRLLRIHSRILRRLSHAAEDDNAAYGEHSPRTSPAGPPFLIAGPPHALSRTCGETFRASHRMNTASKPPPCHCRQGTNQVHYVHPVHLVHPAPYHSRRRDSICAGMTKRSASRSLCQRS